MIIKKPTIFIYTFRPDPGVLKEICAGMEEEGVFYEIAGQTDTTLDALAWNAANDSMLGCGIGICEQEIALQIKGLKLGHNVEYYCCPSAQDSRRLGANGARAVKKQALR